MGSKKVKRRKVAAAKAAGVTREQNSKKFKAVPPGRTTLAKCSCLSREGFQDDRYGKGVRVHNVGRNRVSCTVCGAQRYQATTETDKSAAA